MIKRSKCGVCRKAGHNKRTCRNKPAKKLRRKTPKKKVRRGRVPNSRSRSGQRRPKSNPNPRGERRDRLPINVDARLKILQKQARQDGSHEAWERYTRELERAKKFDPLAVLNQAIYQGQQQRDAEMSVKASEDELERIREEELRTRREERWEALETSLKPLVTAFKDLLSQQPLVAIHYLRMSTTKVREHPITLRRESCTCASSAHSEARGALSGRGSPNGPAYLLDYGADADDGPNSGLRIRLTAIYPLHNLLFAGQRVEDLPSQASEVVVDTSNSYVLHNSVSMRERLESWQKGHDDPLKTADCRYEPHLAIQLRNGHYPRPEKRPNFSEPEWDHEYIHMKGIFCPHDWQKAFSFVLDMLVPHLLKK